MLQGAKTVLDPVPSLPGPDESWPADGRVETHHVELLLPGRTDDDEGHGAIRRTGGSQPCIAHPRHLRTRPPRPLAVLLQVVALDLLSIGQVEGVGTLPFHQEGAFVGRRDMAHELRITKPAIGHDHRRGQRDATPAKSRHASIEHALYPVQFVAARCSRAWRVWTPNGKVHGHHQLTLADDYDQQHPVNTGEHPVLL